MKNFLILLFLCLTTLNSFSQKRLTGKYCLSWVGGISGGTCVKFLENREFSWETGGDMGISSSGRGYYEINESQLFLKFNNDTLTYDSTVKLIETIDKKRDSISLKLKFIDFQKQPVAGLTIILDNTQKYQSDINGILEIKNIRRSEHALTIHTNNLYALENYSFKIIPKVDTSVLITLHPQKPKLISNETFTYKIVEKSDQELKLQNTKGQILKFSKTNQINKKQPNGD